MIKREEIANPNSCLNKAADAEPLFVLRAHDATSPAVVQVWIDVNGPRLGWDHPKIVHAQAWRDEALAWPDRKMPD